MNRLLMIVALAAILAITAGCASSPAEVVYVQPDCELPPLPAESGLDVRELDALSDETFARLDHYIEGLIDSVHEHREMLRAACATGDRTQQTD